MPIEPSRIAAALETTETIVKAWPDLPQHSEVSWAWAASAPLKNLSRLHIQATPVTLANERIDRQRSRDNLTIAVVVQRIVTGRDDGSLMAATVEGLQAYLDDATRWPGELGLRPFNSSIDPIFAPADYDERAVWTSVIQLVLTGAR